jgi:hypothetical protein
VAYFTNSTVPVSVQQVDEICYEFLHICVYLLQDEHIKVIISLLEKHGRDPKVLDVLCSLCVGNGVAVRSSQNNICDFLLPGKNLLLQTQLVDHVAR